MSFWRRILCLLHFHRWAYTEATAGGEVLDRRVCVRCRRRERLEHDFSGVAFTCWFPDDGSTS